MKNKKIVVIISIFLIIVLMGSVFAYLYFMTDIFKSSRELFAKYFVQELQSLEKVTELQTTQIYNDLKYKDAYESNTNIKIIDSEGGEVSAPLNNLAAKLDIQRDNERQYFYADSQLLYENENYLEAEIIKEQDIYGVRFKDAAQQFVTVKKDEKFEDIAKEIGIDASQLGILINMIDGNEQTEVEEQTSKLKNKYWNIITTALSNGTFEKQKNAMITYNNATTETNAYSVLLNSEQVKSVLKEILNNIETDFESDLGIEIGDLDDDPEIPAMKITVFEQKERTIRTTIEIGSHKIQIESSENEEETVIEINYTDLNNDQVIESKLEIVKKNVSNEENFEIVLNVTEGEEEYAITFLSKIQLLDNKIEFNAEISYEQGITKKAIVVANEINITNDFEKTATLENEKNILLNDGQEQKRKQMIELVKRLVAEKTVERIGLIEGKIFLQGEAEENTDLEQIPQVEINKFNAKFEFYTGNEVSAENVKMLLEVVKNNLASYEIIDDENQENTESIIPNQNKVSITLKIQKDATSEDFEKIVEKIDNNKKYKVLINYKTSNGLIDYITINEI